MILGPLFHWSPAVRRESILRSGLMPKQESLAGTQISYVCLGTNPRRAWQLSGDTDWGSEEEDWDLWQVTLAETDDVRVRAEYGPEILEVKVHHVIPADRLWWVGTRQPWLT